jgi:hypothetical protein
MGICYACSLGSLLLASELENFAIKDYGLYHVLKTRADTSRQEAVKLDDLTHQHVQPLRVRHRRFRHAEMRDRKDPGLSERTEPLLFPPNPACRPHL